MPLRVVHVISSPEGLGGAEDLLASLIAEGVRRGDQQLVLQPFAAHSGTTEIAAAVAPVPARGFPVSSLRSVPALRRWLAREIRTFAPDVVHAHLFHAILAVASLPRRAGVSNVLTHHHGGLLLQQERRLDATLDRLAGSRFDVAVAVSDAVQGLLLDTYRWPADRVQVIRNGWSGHPLPHVPDARPTLLTVGNLRREKGHDTLLTAFSLVLEDVPDARLVLVGDGPQRDALHRRASELHVESSVEWAGFAPDVWPFLARAWLFALPSFEETGGIAALEAMAAGLPVVASRVGGLPEVVADGATGLLVPPGDPAALAAPLVRLLTDADLRASMGAAARHTAGHERRADAVERYFQLYADLAAVRRGTRS